MSRVVWVLALATGGCFSKPPIPTGDGGSGGDAHGRITGRTWQKRANASQPPALLAPKMAYDVQAGRVLMYGGQIDGSVSDQMWRLDPSGWVQVCSGCAPGALENQGFAYDRGRHVTVMYGGFNSAVPVSDVWEFDSSAWTRRTPTPTPPTLQSHQMVYDENANRMIIASGATDNTGTAVSTATYFYDGTSWMTSTAVAPTSIDASTEGVYDASSQRMVLAGDVTSQMFGDSLYAFQGNTWQQRCTSCSGDPRQDAAMIFDRGRATVLWIGGYSETNGRLDTVSYLDATDRWTNESQTGLPRREGWGVAYDEARDTIVLYGGWTETNLPCGGPCNSDVCECNETWEGLPVYGP